MLLEQRDDCVMTLTLRSGQRRPPRSPVELRSVAQQQARRVDVALHAGDKQRRLTDLVRPVDLRAVVQQQPRRVDVPRVAGDEKGRCVVDRADANMATVGHILLCVDLCAAVQELRHRVDIAGLGRCVQRVNMLLEQRDDGRVAFLLRDAQRRLAVLIRLINVRTFI